MKLCEIQSREPSSEIEKWMKDHVESYGGYINDEGLIVTRGDSIKVKNVNDDHLPYPFGNVRSFGIYNSPIRSLVNFPRRVTSLMVSGADLDSLAGFPQVTETVSIVGCELESLEHGPTHVDGDFACTSNNLKSLAHAPGRVDGNFDCRFNEIESLSGIHKIVTQINGKIYLSGNPIKRAILGLLLIEDLTHVDVLNGPVIFHKAVDIVNKYLWKGRAGVLAAQQELLDAGLDDYAQL